MLCAVGLESLHSFIFSRYLNCKFRDLCFFGETYAINLILVTYSLKKRLYVVSI